LQAWEGDSAALNKFMAGCGVIDTVQYDSLHHPVKSQQAYQTITLKLNSGKVMFRDSIFFVTDEMPVFKGGDKELIRYFSGNIHYPPAKKDVEGTVFISFIVEKDGRVKYAKILRGIGEEFNTEALRVVKNMPSWLPGKKLGTPVRVQMNIPVRFALH
jgi:TonB family protein